MTYVDRLHTDTHTVWVECVRAFWVCWPGWAFLFFSCVPVSQHTTQHACTQIDFPPHCVRGCWIVLAAGCCVTGALCIAMRSHNIEAICADTLRADVMGLVAANGLQEHTYTLANSKLDRTRTETKTHVNGLHDTAGFVHAVWYVLLSTGCRWGGLR